MGFDRGFTLGLAWRTLLLGAALALSVLAWLTPGLVAARIVPMALAVWAGAALLHHITRTNREVARFVEALTHSDSAAHFREEGGTGFGDMAAAFNAAIRRLRDERRQASEALGYLEALVDDLPVAVLTVDSAARVEPGNKVARRLFAQHQGVGVEDFAIYGASFAKLLGNARIEDGEQVMILTLHGRPQRAIVRVATLIRLGQRARAISIEPVQETLNAVEMAAQTDIVRVLTHEILNSLTPVTSLAGTAVELLAQAPSNPQTDDAREAVVTLARRAEGLRHFIDSYRAVARTPVVRRQHFDARAFASEMERLFRSDWPEVRLEQVISAATVHADPDLLAQAMINLLRNAAQAASEHGPNPEVRLSISAIANGRTELRVTDNGPGVAEAIRADIFLPFFTTRKTGTGVGLNLVRQIAIAHGGGVDLANDAGGARFTMIV